MPFKFQLLTPLRAAAAALAVSCAVFGQGTVIPAGGEFAILGNIPGDQVLPSVSLSSSGGVVVWQDSVLDKSGFGIGGAVLNSSFTGGPTFRVNRAITGNQVNPVVQMLANGNTVMLWQSAVTGTHQIFARFAKGAEGAYGTNFYTGDIQVNTYTKDQQVDPVAAALPDGSVVVAWSSYGQDGSLWGVYARRLSASGKAVAEVKGKAAPQFQVNQWTLYNQRNPAIAALANGNYVIAWISEGERSVGGVDVYARIFTANGVPVTDEIPVNTISHPCGTPSVAPLTDGGFTVVWGQRDTVTVTNGWDIWGRAFTAAGSPVSADFTINTYLYGDQYAPKIAAGPSGSLVVWTSMGEDGSREGVYGSYLPGGTQSSSNEFRVNTTTVSQQMHPAVAWNGNEFLVVWASFSGLSPLGQMTGFDLYGQAYTLAAAPSLRRN